MTDVSHPVGALIERFSGLPVLRFEIAGNTLFAWLLAVAIAVLSFAVLRLLLVVFHARLRKLAARTRTTLDDTIIDLLGHTKAPFLLALAVFAASYVLHLDPTLAGLRRWVVVIALTIQVGVWGNRAITLWLERQRVTVGETDPGAITTLQGLSYVVRAVLWVAVVLLMLENLGYNVGTLLAGLGVGGVAIALAVQSILGDLFASLSIALDKPFVTGDFIIVDSYMGTVAKVGLKTTRVTSLGGEQLIFSNSDLLKSRIRNYKRMEQRRVVFGFGVLYQTTPDQLEAIPPFVREVVDGLENTRFDRAHFKEFGDSAYNFEVVYYVLSSDYNMFMDIQQRINLALCRGFAERGIEFAYPTRTLHLDSVPSALPVRVEKPAD